MAPIDNYPLCEDCCEFFDSMHPINHEQFYPNDPMNITKIEQVKPLNYSWFLDEIEKLRIKIKDEDSNDYETGDEEDDYTDYNDTLIILIVTTALYQSENLFGIFHSKFYRAQNFI